MKTMHPSLEITGGIKNAKMLAGNITVDGKILKTAVQVREYLQGQLALGRRVLPCCDCDNFDYQKGCLGHEIKERENNAGQNDT